MIYLFDFFFITGYLLMKDFSLWLLDFRYDIYCRIRNSYIWFETSWIVGSIVFIPDHTASEAMIAFCMCLLTKGVHDVIKHSSYEKNFELNEKSKRNRNKK